MGGDTFAGKFAREPDSNLPLQGNKLSNGTNTSNKPMSKKLSKDQQTKRNEEPFPNPTT